MLIQIRIANWRKCPIFPNVGHLLDDLNLSYDGHLVKGSWFCLLVNSVAECSIEILSLSSIRRIIPILGSSSIWFTHQGIMTVKFQIEFLTNFWGKGVLYKLYTHRATCRNREFVWVWRSLARVSVKILQWCYVKSKKIFQSKIFDNWGIFCLL